MTLWITIISTIIVSAALGFVGGWWFRTRRFYRAALRKKDGNGTLEFAIQPSADGAMEVLIPNNSLKALKRGQAIEGELTGQKNRMIFRLKSV